jgi:hypothetical protein
MGKKVQFEGDRGALAETINQVEEKLPAGLVEEQIAQPMADRRAWRKPLQQLAVSTASPTRRAREKAVPRKTLGVRRGTANRDGLLINRSRS